MRLIDADAMIDEYGEWYTEDGTEEGFIGTLEGVVYMMPTVEAIPVDWLENFLKEESNKGLKSDALLVAYGIIILCKWKGETDGQTD